MNAKICFMGAGNMALSLIGGLIASGYAKEKTPSRHRTNGDFLLCR